MEENFELMQQMLDFKSRWGVQTMNDLFCQFDRAAEKFGKQLDEELGIGWKLSPWGFQILFWGIDVIGLDGVEE